MRDVQAQLANRDFTAERGHVIVVSDGTVTAKDRERNLSQRQEAEARNAHRFCAGKTHLPYVQAANEDAIHAGPYMSDDVPEIL